MPLLTNPVLQDIASKQREQRRGKKDAVARPEHPMTLSHSRPSSVFNQDSGLHYCRSATRQPPTMWQDSGVHVRMTVCQTSAT
eukprot:2484434-Amphidinium_carterae.1